MDFLEKIGYTNRRKRLRKRFSHYSQRVSQSQPLFQKGLHSLAGFGSAI
jgi:hypothetical protein